MTNNLKLTALAAALIALAGCVEDTGSAGGVAMNRTAPAADENACLGAVAAQTGNTVRVLSSETSEANNFVVVGVGADDAPWNCLVNSGVALEVYSATDEGAL